MGLDPENPIVRLCVEGLSCETDHRFEDALSLYMQAWNQSADDFERCISAHYVARQQKTVEDSLRWNLESLARAEAVKDERVREFYPSLYLNVGKSHEEAGDSEQARKYYNMAQDSLSELPEGGYREMVQHGVERALDRMAEAAKPKTIEYRTG